MPHCVPTRWAIFQMTPMDQLLDVMARLRDPEHGCPWDREQTFETILPYTLEEAYEVADAIERGSTDELRDELGDLLFQVVFYARMAEEAGNFSFEDVARSIVDKMIRRHPHVFGGEQVTSSDHQTQRWEEIKAAERGVRVQGAWLDEVSVAFPALLRAYKLQKRAAKVGFDWPDAEGPVAKIVEETAEVRAALTAGNRAAIEEEIGDLLFSCVNLARKAEVNPESALRTANAKFQSRFTRVEKELQARGQTLDDATLAQMDALWDQMKLDQK